jgi:hypothetical protein
MATIAGAKNAAGVVAAVVWVAQNVEFSGEPRRAADSVNFSRCISV